MEYRGRYGFFDVSRIRKYSVFSRKSKFNLSSMMTEDDVKNTDLSKYEVNLIEKLRKISSEMLKRKKEKRKVILITGAHVVKNGLGTFYIWLMKNGLVDHIASNGAMPIHDLEIAMVGMTSEDVPDALRKGKFGFAMETADLLNLSAIKGNEEKIGYGEAIGKLLNGEYTKMEFPYREFSVVWNAYRLGIPYTVHVALGNDIIHMHPSFDGEAVGGCSGRDFYVFAKTVEELEKGVVLLIGSVVIGVETFLKAVSMSANVGKPPMKILTADFDMRDVKIEDVERNDPTKPSYYFRDIKSVVVRIPRSFDGVGYYVKGNYMDTIPAFWKILMDTLEKDGVVK